MGYITLPNGDRKLSSMDDISILKVRAITPTNCGNAECEVISSTFWGAGGLRLVYIDNPIIGNIYEIKMKLMKEGNALNWRDISTVSL